MLQIVCNLDQSLHCLPICTEPLPTNELISEMHETTSAAAADDNSKCEHDSLLLADPDNDDSAHDVIEIVAMENGNHIADLPRINKEVSACLQHGPYSYLFHHSFFHLLELSSFDLHFCHI